MKIAVDLGGTNVRAARIIDGECHDRMSVPCPSDQPEEVVVACIISLIARLIGDDVDGIGIGVPSVVDPQKGIVYNAANIPSWREVHLKECIENKLNLPVKVNNDCNCFVLGEWKYGAVQGIANVVGITLGTGVGAGLILDNRLYSGVLCGAGEVGSLPFKDADYEHYCSSMWFREKLGMSGDILAKRAEQGDKEAIEIWHEFGHNLGELSKAILYAYSPEAIVVGGGIAESFHLFIDGWQESMASFPYQAISENCRLLKASNSDANLLGASLL